MEDDIILRSGKIKEPWIYPSAEGLYIRPAAGGEIERPTHASIYSFMIVLDSRTLLLSSSAAHYTCEISWIVNLQKGLLSEDLLKSANEPRQV